jgi:hypothetical protein
MKVLLLLASTIYLQALADISNEPCVEEGTCANDTVRVEEEFDYDDEDDYDYDYDEEDDEEDDEDDEEEDNCVDTHVDCGVWAGRGECTANFKYMHQGCKKSCGLCDDDIFEE